MALQNSTKFVSFFFATKLQGLGFLFLFTTPSISHHKKRLMYSLTPESFLHLFTTQIWFKQATLQQEKASNAASRFFIKMFGSFKVVEQQQGSNICLYAVRHWLTLGRIIMPYFNLLQHSALIQYISSRWTSLQSRFNK